LRFRLALAALVAVSAAILIPTIAAAGKPGGGAGLYPDLQTVVPRHLSVQNTQQREYLRFANGIANTGAGPLQLRPDPPVGTPTEFTTAMQQILDAGGNVVQELNAGSFEWHEAHNHWHIGNVALFEVRKGLDDGRGGSYGAPYVNDRGQAQSIKTTFCLIDWYALEGNSNTKERVFWDCARSLQGISPGWVDQYHQSLDGQELDITAAPVGVYYLVSTANPDAFFAETSRTNNTAWVSFRLTRDSKGNAKLAIIGNSPCATPGLCGVNAPNR
jgi:Lysyl oxidase